MTDQLRAVSGAATTTLSEVAFPRGVTLSRAELAELFAKSQNQAINDIGIAVYDRLIEQRVVNTYGPASGYDRALRERAAKLMDQKLDHRGPAVFIHDVEALLQDPSIRSYLAELRTALTQATPQSPARLWELTLARAGSEREATRWLATLLQDFTPEILQGLGFIRMVQDSPGKAELLTTLKAVAAGIQGGTLRPLPPGVESTNQSFYHYYVPRHLAQLLVDDGIPRNLAFLVAGTFNLEYALLAPSLLDQRHDAVLAEVATIFSQATGSSRQQLDARVEALRHAGAVNGEFVFADLDFDQDLQISPAQLERFLTAVGERYGITEGLRDTVTQRDGKTLHRVTQTVTALQFASFLKNKTAAGFVDVILKPGYAVYQNGVDRPVLLTRDNIAGAQLGFAGAAHVLPSQRPPFSEENLAPALLRLGPKPFMSALYKRMGPSAGDQTAGQLQSAASADTGATLSAIMPLFKRDPVQGSQALEQVLARHDDQRALARRLLTALPSNAPTELETQLRRTALVGLDPPAARDQSLETLTALVGRGGERVRIGVVDQAFSSLSTDQRTAPNHPRQGVDLIDDDKDPYARSVADLIVRHGTPVMQLATRGSDALVPIPIRSGIYRVTSAIEHAAREGASVVNISQEMVAASAQDLETFRAALRAYPDVLVVMAAGNRGRALGATENDLAAIDEPNFVKVAAATADGRLSRRSDFHPEHVQFIARGGTRDASLHSDRYLSGSLNAVYGAVLPNEEMTSHSAPAVANIAAKVRLLAQHLSAPQVVALLAASSDTTDALASRARYGVIDRDLALGLAATLTLVRNGETPGDASQRVAQALNLGPVVRQRLGENAAALARRISG